MKATFTRTGLCFLLGAFVLVFLDEVALDAANDDAAAAQSASPAPEPPRAAQPKVFFLVTYVSVRIPGGIRGVLPGTRVTLVQDLGDRLRVKDEEIEFEVKRDQITDKAAVAMGVSQSDSRAQQQLSDTAAGQRQQSFQEQQRGLQQQDQAKNHQDELRKLERRYAALQQEEGNLLLEIGDAQQVNVQPGRHGVVHYPNSKTAELPFLRGRLDDVRHEKNKARQQLEEAQRR